MEISPSKELHLGRLLGNALRRFDARVLELMSQDVELPLKWSNYAGRGVVTAAQTHMVRHLPEQGARLTDLAQSAGLTKQAMKSLIDQCEAMGLVSRQVLGAEQQQRGEQSKATGDRREKWISYTEQGKLWRVAFYRAVQTAEQECSEELGEAVLAVIRIGVEAYGSTHDRGYVS
jgi:DNA-binding MarR family transcriptional regulator